MSNFNIASHFVLLLSCLFFTANAYSEEYFHSSRHNHGYWIGEPGSGEAMVADALVARPIGLLTTVIGSTIYVVSLPFSILGGNEKNAREKLVNEPASYTFKRPLGEF